MADGPPGGGTPAIIETAPDARPWRERLVEGAVVFFVQVAAITAATWPLARVAGTHAPGNLGDPLLNAYLIGWGGHTAIRDPLHIFHATMFDPERFSLAFLENMLGLSLPLAPLLWLTDNALLTVNVGLLLYPAVAGLGAYLLARELSVRRGPALVCAVAFTVTPARLAQIAHFHVYAVYWLPYILLLLARLTREPSTRGVTRRRVVALALVTALGMWSSLTGTILIGLVVAGWAAWVLVAHDARLRALRRGLAGLLAGFVLGVPVVVPYFLVRGDHPGYRHSEDVARTFSAEPASFLSPPAGGAVVDEVYEELTERYGRDEGYWEKQLFAGLWLTTAAAVSLVVAVVVALRARRRQLVATPVLAIAVVVVGFVFSLGPRLGGDEDGVPLPFLLAQSVVGGLTRVPARLGTVVPLGLALLAGWGLSQAPRRWRHVLVAASAVVVVLEIVPSAVDMVEAPPLTAAHRAVGERGGVVLGLPTSEYDEATGAFMPDTLGRDASHLFLSTANYRRIVNGYAAYHPSSYWEVIDAVQDLPSTRAFEVFHRRDIRTVVVQSDMVRGTRWEDVASRLEAWPGVRLFAAGEGVRIYDVSGAAGTAPG